MKNKSNKAAVLIYKVTLEQRKFPEIRKELCNDKRVNSPRKHTLLNVYVINNTISKYLKQKLTN